MIPQAQRVQRAKCIDIVSWEASELGIYISIVQQPTFALTGLILAPSHCVLHLL